MAKLHSFSPYAAACCALASVSGCSITTTTNGRNQPTVTINGVVVSGGLAANAVSETVQKKFKAASVAILQADNTAGSFEIRSIENGPDEIHITAKKTISGNESVKALTPLLASVTVQAELLGQSLVLTSKHSADFNRRNIGVMIDYVVTVPARLALDLRTGSGAISVTGVKGWEKLHSDYGNIELKEVGNYLDIFTNSGSISVEHSPDAQKITAKSSYGNIGLTQVAGDIDAETNSGTLTVEGLRNAGKVKLHSGYGNVTLSNGCGSVDASSNSGIVKVSDCQLTSHLVMSSNYGNVEATSITGASPELQADLTTQSGSVTYNGDVSKLSLQSNYGSVNGELGAAIPLQSADLKSSSGAVTLVLPSTASARVDGSTAGGAIQFPNMIDAGSSPVESRRFTTTLGSGAARVSMKSAYGNVILRTK